MSKVNFKGTINSELLKRCMKTVSNIITEGKIYIKENGLHVHGTGMGQIAYISWDLNKIAFSEYSFEKTEEILVDFTNFMKFLSRFNEEIKISITEKNLILADSSRRFTIPLLTTNIEDNKFEIDEIKSTVKFEIMTKDFKDLLDDASLFGDTITFKTIGQELQLESSEYSGLQTFDSKLSIGSILLKMESSVDSKVRINLEYLKKFLEKSVSESIKIRFEADKPIIAVQETEKTKLEILIAPRVDEE